MLGAAVAKKINIALDNYDKLSSCRESNFKTAGQRLEFEKDNSIRIFFKHRGVSYVYNAVTSVLVFDKKRCDIHHIGEFYVDGEKTDSKCFRDLLKIPIWTPKKPKSKHEKSVDLIKRMFTHNRDHALFAQNRDRALLMAQNDGVNAKQWEVRTEKDNPFTGELATAWTDGYNGKIKFKLK